MTCHSLTKFAHINSIKDYGKVIHYEQKRRNNANYALGSERSWKRLLNSGLY